MDSDGLCDLIDSCPFDPMNDFDSDGFCAIRCKAITTTPNFRETVVTTEEPDRTTTSITDRQKTTTDEPTRSTTSTTLPVRTTTTKRGRDTTTSDDVVTGRPRTTGTTTGRGGGRDTSTSTIDRNTRPTTTERGAGETTERGRETDRPGVVTTNRGRPTDSTTTKPVRGTETTTKPVRETETDRTNAVRSVELSCVELVWLVFWCFFTVQEKTLLHSNAGKRKIERQTDRNRQTTTTTTAADNKRIALNFIGRRVPVLQCCATFAPLPYHRTIDVNLTCHPPQPQPSTWIAIATVKLMPACMPALR